MMHAAKAITEAERIAQWFHAYLPAEIDPSGDPTQFDALRFAWGYIFQRTGTPRDDVSQGPAMRGYDYAAAHPDEEV